MKWSELFTYDASTGLLTWKPRIGEPKRVAKFNKAIAGTVAGCKVLTPTGFHRGVSIGIRTEDGAKSYYAHRIIWEMHHGPIPDDMLIDHINGDAWDNRIENLRLGSMAQNLQNMRLRPQSSSRLKGVYWDKSKNLWAAEIRAHGTRYHLGRFQTKGLAAVARAKAAIRYHGQFARFV